MKAADLFEKYSLELHGPETPPEKLNDVVYRILMEFCNESKDILEKRHIKYDSGMIAVLREQNDKWNCLARMLEKTWGFSYLKKDGFKLFWENELKGLKVK